MNTTTQPTIVKYPYITTVQFLEPVTDLEPGQIAGRNGMIVSFTYVGGRNTVVDFYNRLGCPGNTEGHTHSVHVGDYDDWQIRDVVTAACAALNIGVRVDSLGWYQD